MERVQAVLRRTQGELLLLERQLRHYERMLVEYYNYSSLLSAVTGGRLVRMDVSLVETETKAAALKFRTYDYAQEISKTGQAIEKLLGELAGLPYTTALSLTASVEEVRRAVRHRTDVCARIVPLLERPADGLGDHLLFLKHLHAPSVEL